MASSSSSSASSEMDASAPMDGRLSVDDEVDHRMKQREAKKNTIKAKNGKKKRKGKSEPQSVGRDVGHLRDRTSATVLRFGSETSSCDDGASNDNLISSRKSREWRLKPSQQNDFLKGRASKDTLEREGKSVRHFYKHQAHLLDAYLELDRLHGDTEGSQGTSQEDAVNSERTKTLVKWAIWISFGVNVLLFVAKVFAAASSGSLTVIASAVDSFLDLLSGSIIFVTALLMRRNNLYNYPAGNARLEPLGIIAFSACMFTATLQLLTLNIETLIKNDGSYLKIDIVSMVILGATVVVKLGLWLFCRSKDNESVQVLAQDHFNDVLSNTFGAIAVLVAKFSDVWQIDPASSIIMSLYIMANWAATGYEQVRNMSGRSASPVLLKQLTYLVWNHDERVLQIDTVRAFHLGLGFLVEVDVVLPATMPLHEAHDIGESLQMKLERVDMVERAFVHLDYETSHAPEHTGSDKSVRLLTDE